MGAMNGLNMTQIYDRIADVLMPTQYAQWSFVSRNGVMSNVLLPAKTCRFSNPISTFTVDSCATPELSVCSSQTSAQRCATYQRCLDSSFKCLVSSRGEGKGRWRKMNILVITEAVTKTVSINVGNNICISTNANTNLKRAPEVHRIPHHPSPILFISLSSSSLSSLLSSSSSALPFSHACSRSTDRVHIIITIILGVHI